jgi:hypothetical protein
MKNILCICALLAIIAGCKSKIPSGILQPAKVEAVLYDIHISDAFIATLVNQDSAKKVAASYYKGIYKKFDTDSAEYTRSMNFYYAHPEMLNTMYDRVTEKLKKSKDSLDKIEVKRQAKIAAAEKKIQAAAEKKKKNSLTKDSLKKPGKLKPSVKMNKDSLNKAARLKNTSRTVPVTAVQKQR